MSRGPLHAIPLVDQAMRALAESDGTVLLAAGADEALAVSLKRLFGTPELFAAVAELCIFAVWLGEKKNAPDVRDRLIRVAELAVPELEAMGLEGAELAQDILAAAEKDYRRVTGRSLSLPQPPRAPRDGEVKADPGARFRLLGPSASKPKKKRR
jgi:hypothetical protein